MSEGRGARREARGADEGRGAEERLNLAIDLTVRQMLDVEQPAGLRGRVLQRIEAGNSGAGVASTLVASTFRWKVLLPVAAAAAILILALLPTRTPEAPRPTTVARVEPPQTPPVGVPAVPGPASPAFVEPRLSTRSQSPALAPARDRAIVAATLLAPEYATTEITPLGDISPIQVAPMADHRIAPPDMAMRPLSEITEVQIAPLNPPDRRN